MGAQLGLSKRGAVSGRTTNRAPCAALWSQWCAPLVVCVCPLWLISTSQHDTKQLVYTGRLKHRRLA